VVYEIVKALLIVAVVLIGFHASNILYDRGIPQYLSRKCGHFFGGIAYLISPFLFEDAWIPIGLSGAFAVLLLAARLLRPRTFRGVGGTGRQTALAEVFFPISGTVSLAIGWGVVGEPWLGVVPCLFMAFGDCLTGITRSMVYHREVKGFWGSMAMLVVCLAVAVLMEPYWVGALGAVVAVFLERFTFTRGWIDDNLTIPIGALVAMVFLI
jgi:dolichol kinase